MYDSSFFFISGEQHDAQRRGKRSKGNISVLPMSAYLVPGTSVLGHIMCGKDVSKKLDSIKNASNSHIFDYDSASSYIFP